METTSSVMRLLLTSYTKWLTISIFIIVSNAFMGEKAFLEGFISTLLCHSGHFS